jgi:two-component sensor histidine kinase
MPTYASQRAGAESLPAIAKSSVRYIVPSLVVPSETSEQVTTLEQLEHLIESCVGGLEVEPAVRDQAYARALALLDEKLAGDHTVHVASIGFVQDMLAAHTVDLAADLPALRELIHRLESGPKISAFELGRELVRVPDLLHLPGGAAIELQLALLMAFTDARAVSIWRPGSTGEVERIAHAGEPGYKLRLTQKLARRLLGPNTRKYQPSSEIAGVRVEGVPHPAAIVASGPPPGSSHRELLLEAALPTLAAALSRVETYVGRPQATKQVRAALDDGGAAGRRLARMRFDLHDGPQQDVILLAEDLRLFRSQLESVLEKNRRRERLLGRVDDLEARLIALDGDLRRLSVSAESPFLHSASLRDTLREIVDAFARRTGIDAQLRFEGEIMALTDSQHIAVVGLINESLSNVREHSGAKQVSILIADAAEGLHATVTDRGCGFDPEATLVKAAREGRLGLVGMHERVRLLGGRAEIDSRPGGPTVISLTLPKAPDGVPTRA